MMKKNARRTDSGICTSSARRGQSKVRRYYATHKRRYFRYAACSSASDVRSRRPSRITHRCITPRTSSTSPMTTTHQHTNRPAHPPPLTHRTTRSPPTPPTTNNRHQHRIDISISHRNNRTGVGIRWSDTPTHSHTHSRIFHPTTITTTLSFHPCYCFCLIQFSTSTDEGGC